MKILILVTVLLLGGCSAKGMKVGNDYQGCPKEKASCTISDKNISGSYKISRVMAADAGYTVEGTAIMNRSIGEDYRGAGFTLYLVKNGIIVEEIGMVSSAGDASKAMAFHGDFRQDFDSSTMGYFFRAR